MRRFSLTESTNPALRQSEVFGTVTGTETASVQGVVNKTAMLTVIAVIGGAIGVSIAPSLGQGAMLGVVLVTALVTLGLYFAAIAKPMASVVLAPVYAIIEGCFLGIFTSMVDGWLAANDVAVSGGVALQAFVITIAILASMLILYTTRIIQPTRKFQAVVGTCMLGIVLVYLISLPLYLFGIQVPFISAFTTPTSGGGWWIGMGINLFILIIASLMLIIDFGIIEQKIKSGAPKRMEWFCGFILLVSLAWIYIQCVELVARLAQRD
tara:strand:+ start:2378 stop:3178 length:801 start_codon:yes stop_codon:yes gene_type:complete